MYLCVKLFILSPADVTPLLAPLLLCAASALGPGPAPEAGDVVGRWTSTDVTKHPVEFKADGTCLCGFVVKDGRWRVGEGTYRVEADGRIVAKLRIDSIAFSRWWRLEDGALYGPHGPAPRVRWERKPADR
jgi:hypothetical protein